ncbi:WD40-repeat-containing domain protein [Gautieria morchelliformis]|nr:WD40-repeat-containing domain protein [Gautieria morchelliformis]
MAEPSSSTTASSSQSSAVAGKLEIMSRAMFAPFSHRKTDSTRILADLAPVIMTPRMMNAAAASSSRRNDGRAGGASHQLGFATLGRSPMRLSLRSRRVTSRDLQIVEAAPELLREDVPEPEGIASDVSLLRGFKATMPSATKGKMRRRQARNVDVGPLGLKKLGSNVRGLLDEDLVEAEASEGDDVVLIGKKKGKWKPKRRGRQSLGAGIAFGKEELERQTDEIIRDKENSHVRRTLISSEISEITHKITALDAIRNRLEQDLLKLQEDELELDDELEGVRERERFEQRSHSSSTTDLQPPMTSRRRRGPAFLPSEHHELPPGVAFMTLSSHTAPITALDFNEPYGFLVTTSQDETVRLWDLCSGEDVGRLTGHRGVVKCLQVEDQLCLTGGADADVHIWDLRLVEGYENEAMHADKVGQSSNSVIRDAAALDGSSRNGDGCVKTLQGHSQSVSSLFFEGNVLVTGASDKTIRQWDMNTGQCVLAMDILWAIAHPASTQSFYAPLSASGIAPSLIKGAAAAAGVFSVPTPPYADGSWDMYEDFVGGLQIVYEGLISGSGDGAVRMWDMRTGSVSRTLMGHTGPVTCVACDIDTFQIVSGSLDKTIRIWDIRTGGFFETLRYDHGVTSLQFDTRKVVACAGENGIKIYNRTTMQHSTLNTNGHTSPIERVRYMDKFMASGGRDAIVKIWAL